MKKRLVYIGLTGFLLCLFAFAQAQNGQMPSAQDRAAKMTEWMKTNLTPTADQLPKLEEINLRYSLKMDSLRTGSGDRSDKFKVMKTENAAKDAELKTILTDSQYQIYQTKQAEMKQKMKDKMKENKQGTDQ